MKELRYLLTLFLVFLALSSAPLSAQEDAVDEGSEEVSNDDSSKKKKKKKKKKSKSRKGSKSETRSKDEADDEESTETEAPAENAVVAAFNKFKNIGGKLNRDADFYIYFATSSTCTHCQRCMPVAVEQYKKMRSGRKVELIVISADTSEAAAKQHLKSHKMKNACMMFSALQATQLRGLPGCGMMLPPSVSIVSKDGKQIKSAIGAQQVIDILNNWKSFTVGGK